MDLYKQTIPMTVRKIVKKKKLLGVDIYDIYISGSSIHPKFKKAGQKNIIGPVVCVTSKHYLPTKEGYKDIKDIRVGTKLLVSIDLITK